MSHVDIKGVTDSKELSTTYAQFVRTALQQLKVQQKFAMFVILTAMSGDIAGEGDNMQHLKLMYALADD